jgi:hypothetical protein
MVAAKVKADVITNEICSHANVKTIFELLRKREKNEEDY